MFAKALPLLAATVLLTACHRIRPDNTDSKFVPPPVREHLTWESFFHEPWPDPLHDKYQELFATPFPNRSPQHFEIGEPFDDVNKYDLAFEATAVPGAQSEAESGGGKHAVSIRLPDSAGKSIEMRPDAGFLILSVKRPVPAHRYRAYRNEDRAVPIPPGADPSTARLVRDGDWVRVKFAAKSDAKTPAPR